MQSDHPELDDYEEFLDAMDQVDLNRLSKEIYERVGANLTVMQYVLVCEYQAHESSNERLQTIWLRLNEQILRHLCSTPGSAVPIEPSIN